MTVPGVYAQYAGTPNAFRTFVLLNTMSYVNCVVALILGIIQRNSTLGYVLGIGVPTVWIVGKMSLSWLINLQVSGMGTCGHQPHKQR